jgi:Ca2+/H+ antiporter, TMEM165/GDT1 family
MVEVVEAFTIVLAAATIAGLRPATLGTIGGLGVLAVIVLVFGPILDRIPLNLLQLAIGVLLLLFGLRWLRKAILRAAGVVALRNERMAFEESEQMLREAAEMRATRLKWLAMLTAFKAVVIEGLEVVFIVIAVGSGRGLLIPASLGALAAC